MYCITASKDLQFPYFISEGDSLIIDEDMELLSGDLVLLQLADKKEVSFYSDFMTVNEGVTAHLIKSVSKPCKDSDRALRLQRCGVPKLDSAIDELKGISFLLDCVYCSDDIGSHIHSKEGIDLLSVHIQNILKKLETVRDELE